MEVLKFINICLEKLVKINRCERQQWKAAVNKTANREDEMMVKSWTGGSGSFSPHCMCCNSNFSLCQFTNSSL